MSEGAARRTRFDSPEEKREWRKAQLLRASRAFRERRRSEAINLAAENERLLEERRALMEELKSLESNVAALEKATATEEHEELMRIAAAENALLKMQLEQHALFLMSLHSLATEAVPTNDSVNREIAVQTIESARLAIESFLVKFSQQDGMVPPFVLDYHARNMRALVRIAVSDDGKAYVRCDTLTRKPPAAPFRIPPVLRDAAVLPWYHSTYFKAAYIPLQADSVFEMTMAPDLSWDPLPEDPNKLGIKTSYVVEFTPQGSLEWVFLTATSERTLPTAMLGLEDDVEQMLWAYGEESALKPPQDAAASAKKPRVEKAKRDETISVSCGHRSVTCHFSAHDSSSERIVDEITESVYIWEEDDAEGEKMVRGINTMTCGRDTRIPPWGPVFQRIHELKCIPEDVQTMLYHYVDFVSKAAYQEGVERLKAMENET